MTDLERGLEALPAHCRAGMMAYVMAGRIPGQFLQAVIRNNLVDAFGLADSVNLTYMAAYAQFLKWAMPPPAWGSELAMQNWSQIGGLVGYEKEKEKEKKKQQREGSKS